MRNRPETVDRNLVGFFDCCWEHLKQLHQHYGEEVDDDMCLHGMKALWEVSERRQMLD